MAPDFDIDLEDKKTDCSPIYDDDTKAKMAAARKGNKDGFRDLTLAVQGTAFNLVREAKTEELPNGDLKLAWSKLVDEWDPQMGQEMVSLVTKFQQTKLEDPKMNVTDWLTDLSWQRAKLKRLKYTINDTFYMMHELANLPIQYTETVSSMQIELRKEKKKRKNIYFNTAAPMLEI